MSKGILLASHPQKEFLFFKTKMDATMYKKFRDALTLDGTVSEDTVLEDIEIDSDWNWSRAKAQAQAEYKPLGTARPRPGDPN